jgi:hypothetical protein
MKTKALIVAAAAAAALTWLTHEKVVHAGSGDSGRWNSFGEEGAAVRGPPYSASA